MSTDANSAGLELATLGGGCFWCLEAVFDELAGVEDVVSGYTGGHTAKPDYHQVCAGDSGHAEVVQVSFDPARITYREILEVFFAIHDPTTLNRQGNDVGTQYRSAIYFHSPRQQAEAAALLKEFATENTFGAPVVTTLTPAGTFHPAEDYHQQYFRNNERQPYCQFVVAPKLVKFRQLFAAKRKVK
ncbi:MAG: peptide-methionine (S)-S-oxide reductase MsrA [Rhodocyclaceae bacterium]|jgi:peptide-methionine (S)-S-oxide reductase|nr:peptide-methionine (S)-S-oxide reductase MsrA [Rhodocyclaceae bacterium]MCP5296960.1 peptide-methionine (S)-S-oxide reductase MsrA [Zoogloeaceae bacterium]PKO66649.1 MAG: peptide-methionine (S)-S-oxide reductase [Betaproteobacteria bacterium HGW-Betaproteobacteria-14]MCB1891101.1 peptide-methionine (S)-S-oxide reductase MsrA [Rhodocyclaceae bacterium]MCO5098084.1 peptide-methionine (S)-S-oxide reductase MsrA [Rhodocyclaceae bacterium]